MTTELSQRPNSNSRSPYGERGLKYEDNPVCSRAVRSLSLRRAWIEIKFVKTLQADTESLSLRRAWIEILTCNTHSSARYSRSLYGERGLKFDYEREQ